MAEEKKPRIDLKARLGKGAATPPPPQVGGGIPMPGLPTPGIAAPTPNPAAARGSVPPGIPVGPPPAFGQTRGVAIDPSNPLAAAATPYRAPAPPPPPQAPRIEVDEVAVHEARKGARKQGLIAGLVAAAVLGAVGYIAGGAIETNKGRQKSVGDAKSLALAVARSREQLKLIADKVEEGKKSLLVEKKFP